MSFTVSWLHETLSKWLHVADSRMRMMIMMAVTEVLRMSDDRLDNTENVIMGINMNNDDD